MFGGLDDDVVSPHGYNIYLVRLRSVVVALSFGFKSNTTLCNAVGTGVISYGLLQLFYADSNG